MSDFYYLPKQTLNDLATSIQNLTSSNVAMTPGAMITAIQHYSPPASEPIEPTIAIINNYSATSTILSFNKPNNFERLLSLFIINADPSSNAEKVECCFIYGIYDAKRETISYSGYVSNNNLNYPEVSTNFSLNISNNISISNITTRAISGWYTNSNIYTIILTYISNSNTSSEEEEEEE